MKDPRKQARDRMVAQTLELGANAIVNGRFNTSSIAQGASELLYLRHSRSRGIGGLMESLFELLVNLGVPLILIIVALITGSTIEKRQFQSIHRREQALEAVWLLNTRDYPEDRPIAQSVPNAFAIPGGSIGVTRGLFDILTEEIEIAFVIGHELGHFKNRDHLQGIGRAAGYSLMMAVLFDVGAGSESFGRHRSIRRGSTYAS